MTYNADIDWDEMARKAKQATTRLIDALNFALEARNDWNSFREARNDATLATYFTGKGRTTTEAEVTDMRQCFVAMKEVYDFCDNIAGPTQGDRLSSWRKFS